MDNNTTTYKSKFKLWIKIISCVLVIAFLWQDIVWANPEAFTRKTEAQNTLQQPTLFAGLNKVEEFERLTFSYLAREIGKAARDHNPETIYTVQRKYI